MCFCVLWNTYRNIWIFFWDKQSKLWMTLLYNIFSMPKTFSQFCIRLVNYNDVVNSTSWPIGLFPPHFICTNLTAELLMQFMCIHYSVAVGFIYDFCCHKFIYTYQRAMINSTGLLSELYILTMRSCLIAFCLYDPWVCFCLSVWRVWVIGFWLAEKQPNSLPGVEGWSQGQSLMLV